jgi:hypothetical protein
MTWCERLSEAVGLRASLHAIRADVRFHAGGHLADECQGRLQATRRTDRASGYSRQRIELLPMASQEPRRSPEAPCARVWPRRPAPARFVPGDAHVVVQATRTRVPTRALLGCAATT